MRQQRRPWTAELLDTHRTDLLILGGGVIGLSCARAILKNSPTLSVTILDAPTDAMPASQAAAGMLAPYSEFPEDGPLARLCAQSLDLYQDFVAELAQDTGINVSLEGHGTLVPKIPEEAERYRRKQEALSKRGVGLHTLSADDVRALEPGISLEVEEALLLPESLINPRLLHAALKSDFERRGGCWISDRAVDRIENRDRLSGLVLQDGSGVGFDTLLAATGAWSGLVADLLDLRFDVTPVKGQMMSLGVTDGFLRHVIHLKSFYLAPRTGEGIIVGSTMEECGFDNSVHDEFIDEFSAKASTIMPELAAMPVVNRWVGHRPRAADGAPIIGRTDRWENMIVATGHFRNGILLTPITGEIVSTLFFDRTSVDWETFSPMRFAGAFQPLR